MTEDPSNSRLSADESADDALDLWWAMPGLLAGTSMPFIHPERYEDIGAALDAFPDELPPIWRAGIRAMVCLLNIPAAAGVYTAAGFAFHLLPIHDGGVPTLEQFSGFRDFVAAQHARGQSVAVHCEAGLGRTGTLIAGFLIASGFSLERAVTHVRAVRPGAIETALQLRFLSEVEQAFKMGVSDPRATRGTRRSPSAGP